MYKFQSDKPNKQRSIDGFLASGPRKPKSAINSPSARSGQLERQRPARLDDFNRADGFRRTTTSQQISTDGSYQRSQRVQPDRNLSTRVSSGSFKESRRKSRGKRKFGTLVKRTSIFAVILVLVVGGWIFGKAWWSANKVLKGSGGALALNKDVDPYQLKGEGDGRVNVLLMGKGGPEHEGGELTDSIMIASLDPINNGAVLLSLPRDLWVKPSGLWAMKINAVYSSAKNQALYKNPKDKAAAETAGLNAIEKTVEDYMGVPIHYYSMVDFMAFQDAVNTLGGIQVNLEEPYSDPTMLVGRKYFSLPAGQQTLDGGNALAYARSRYGAARGDFDRGEHQQKVILGIKDKALSVGTFANPVKVTQLLNTFGNRVQTNFSINDIMRVYELSKQLNSTNVKNVDLAQQDSAVVRTGSVVDQSVVYPIAGIDNYTKVKEFVRLQLKDGFIIKENPSIIVLNGTGTSGLATKKADELKSYGYNVIQVADAGSTEFTSTQFIDQTKGQKKYTKRYLEQRLGVTAVSKVKDFDASAYTADFIIIVGSQ